MSAVEILPAIILVAMGLAVGIGVLVAASRLVRRLAPPPDKRKDTKK